MTERELESLVAHGARRLRLERVLWSALGALGCGLVLSAAVVFAHRLYPSVGAALDGDAVALSAGLALPVALAVLAALATRWRYHADPVRVALLMDARAGSAEHLVTWLQLKMQAALVSPLPLREGVGGGPDDLSRAFRQAQLASTLALAHRLNPRRLIPVRLPPWSRALWLALLLLCCALLMPPRVRAERRPVFGPDGAERAGQGLVAAGGAGLSDQAPRVQVLKPTDLLSFRLLASDPNLDPAKRAAALKELLRKIGTVPESELAPDVRELLEALRGPKDVEAKAGAKNGSLTAAAKGADPTETAGPLPGAAQLSAFRERAITAVEQHFQDVKEQLARYYTEETRNSKSETRRKEE